MSAADVPGQVDPVRAAIDAAVTYVVEEALRPWTDPTGRRFDWTVLTDPLYDQLRERGCWAELAALENDERTLVAQHTADLVARAARTALELLPAMTGAAPPARMRTTPVLLWQAHCSHCDAAAPDPEDTPGAVWTAEQLANLGKYTLTSDQGWRFDPTRTDPDMRAHGIQLVLVCPACWEVGYCEECAEPIHQWQTAIVTGRDGDLLHARCAPCDRCGGKAIGACCSSHKRPLCHADYRRTHFAEVCVPGCRDCAAEGLPLVMHR